MKKTIQVILFWRDGRNRLKKNDETIENIFRAKQQRRQNLAQLPIEDKVKILVQLQRIASPILVARGLKREPWKM